MGSDDRSGAVGLLLQYDAPLETNLETVRHAEQRGFTQVWQTEYRLGRDAVTPCAAYAAVTDSIQVGIGVINNWTRNVALVAQTMSTLEELAGPDRVLGGIGAWWDPLAANVGIERRAPLRGVREYVEVARRLLAGESVTYDGQFVSLDDVELTFDHHDVGPPLTTDVYVGATGFTMLELTGEFADGCLGNYLVSPDYNERAIDSLERGARRAGRDVEDVDRSQIVVVSMDEDFDVALAAARRFILSYFAPKTDQQVSEARRVSGLSQEIAEDIRAELDTWPASETAIQNALDVIPEDVVLDVTACGTPEQCREKVAEYAATDFCECPVLYPVTDNTREIVDAFASKD